MISLRFDNQSSEWENNNFKYNLGFITHVLYSFEFKLKENKYLYFRDIVRTLGLDPLQYKSTLGWDEKHTYFDYSYSYKVTEDDKDNDYIDIELNPFDLCSENNDCISRQAAIDKMQELEDEDIKAYGCSIPEGFDGQRAIKALKSL